MLTLSPEPAAAARWTDKDLYDLAGKLRTELIKVDNIGTSYHRRHRRRRKSASSPIRKNSRCSASRCSSLIAKVRDANREFVAGSVRDAGVMRTLVGRPDAARRARYRAAAAHHARRPAGLCARRRQGGDRPEHRGTPRVEPDAATARDWDRAPAVSLALAKRAGANAVVVAQDILQRVDALRGPADPARHPRRGHARLRQDRERQGERAAVPSRRSPPSPSWC